MPRVLDELAAGPLTVRAARGPRSRSCDSRRRLLPRLESHGLVTRLNDGKWLLAPSLDERLADAAESLGLAGKAGVVRADAGLSEALTSKAAITELSAATTIVPRQSLLIVRAEMARLYVRAGAIFRLTCLNSPRRG